MPASVKASCHTSKRSWSDQLVKVAPLETNAAIRRGGELGGPGAVVVKRPKRGQDRRLDLPAVGLETVRAMAEVKASCLACEAGQTLFFDRIGALALADEHSIAIVGRI